MRLFLLALCAATALCAQSTPIAAQETERARQMLNSPDWVTKAWGAYLAGRLHSDELQQALIAQFTPAVALRDAPYYSQEHAFLATLFDAAIEAGITIPAALLEPFEERWTDPVLILLARDKDNEDPLLRLRAETSRDPAWLAANNLLLEQRSQRWYEAILGEISITHRFIVTDPASGIGIGAGISKGSCGEGAAEMPKGFPPVTLYGLVTVGYRGSVLLARGPQDAYYLRTVVPTDRRVGSGPCGQSVDRMTIRIGYLAQLTAVPAEKAERLFHGQTPIQYTSLENFAREVEQSLTAQEQGIRAMIHELEQRGLHAPDIRLRIVPEVNDMRQGAKEPLPAVAVKDFALR